jgi:hypothetical protein
MDHEQGDDPAWHEQQDDPSLLNSDFDLCGDYRHHIVYKSNLSSDAYTPTGRILVHDDDVFFDTQEDEAFVHAHFNKHNDNDVDIEAATDRCVFRANAHRYVCSETTYSDADTRPNHHGPRAVSEAPVIMMPFVLVLPGFQPTSSRRLSTSPPNMHGCHSIPSFKNTKSPNPAATYADVMNPWLRTPSSPMFLLSMVGRNRANFRRDEVPRH